MLPRFTFCTGLVLLYISTPAVAQTESFTISIDPVVVLYDPDTGIGSESALIRLVQDPGTPVAGTMGLSMRYSHDPNLFHTASISFTGPIAALNGGIGPGLGNTLAYPGGATSESVYDLLPPLEVIEYPTPTAIFEVVFETNPMHWIGNLVGGGAGFSPDHPPGVPPDVEMEVWVVGGSARPLFWDFPVIEFMPSVPFLRGDADGDGQIIAIGDGITILSGLFSGTWIACEAAADVNGDDAVDVADAVSILVYGFASGPAPPAPFPDCGQEPGGTTLPCDQSGC